MRSVNALTVVKFLVFVIVTFRAGLQRRLDRSETRASMLRMTGSATDACLAMCADDSSDEGFGMMAGGAICIHLFLVRHAYSESVAGGAGTAVRLFGNRGRQDESFPRVRIGNRLGGESNFVCKGGNG